MCKLDFRLLFALFSDWYQVAIKGRRGFYGVAANICSPLTALCVLKKLSSSLGTKGKGIL